MKITDIKASIIFIVFMVIVVLVYMSLWYITKAPILNSPEQHEQAEVIAKRIVKEISGDGDYFINTYIVAFKFSDGLVKELRVGDGRSGRKIYDSINEGDTGILTYKEREDIEEKYKNEDQRWEGMRFISFEKDLPESDD